MGEHLGDGVDIHSLVEEYGGVGVAEAVEGDMLGDTSGFSAPVPRFPFRLSLLCGFHNIYRLFRRNNMCL